MGKWKCYICTASVLILLMGFLVHNDSVGDYFITNFPDINVPDKWGSRDNDNTQVTDILIKVPNATLNLVTERIRNRIVAPVMPNSNFSYGFNGDYLNKVLNYWSNTYQWRKWEDVINGFPHRFTTINGLQIHFIHIKPNLRKDQKSIPILLLHGWPGSFFEFYKLIPLLKSTEKDSFAFEIICPSLVGFGWSERPQIPGFGMIEMSNTMFKLMNRLNITRPFYIQGGDFGSLIAGSMSKIYPGQVAGIHVNMAEIPIYDLRFLAKVFIGSLLPARFHFIDEQDLHTIYPWTKFIGNKVNQMGYFWLQATRPTTIGIALSDSPAGLAAYILEKFGAWSNNLTYHLNSPHGGMENLKISIDEMLTNVMIYYITNSISSSMIFYKEFLTERNQQLSKIPIHTPTGIAIFPNELVLLPEALARIKYRDIRQYTRMPSGGHFAAFEEPELLAKDIRSFINLVENK